MSDEILDEVYAARERLWQLGGGTMRGVCEYLRECGRRAKARGVMWIESEEEREAIAAEVRARLAAEGMEGALCVREEREGYGRAEARGGRGAGISATKGTKDSKRGALRAMKSERRKVKNGGGKAKQAEPLE